MLTREQRDKWADALESGEFNQTFGELCILENSDRPYPPGYCCLGVFGKVILNAKDKDMASNSGNVYDKLEELGIVPKQFYVMNDSNRLSFKEIAVEVRKLPVVEDAVFQTLLVAE